MIVAINFCLILEIPGAGEVDRGKGGQIFGDRRKLTLDGKHNAIYILYITELYTWNLFVLLTNVTPKILIKKKRNILSRESNIAKKTEVLMNIRMLKLEKPFKFLH